MAGFLTYRNFSLRDTSQLDGKVAVITGGQAGIGREISAQLLLHGVEKLFVIGRSKDRYMASKYAWRNRAGIDLGGEDESRVEFIQCDLADIHAVKHAAGQIRRMTDRVHIVICNAGLGVARQYKRSEQDVEWIFATNCLGHQVLVTLLLPLLKETVRQTSSDVRIVVTSSSMHQLCRKLDVDLLASPARPKPVLYDGIWRYARSKLGDILLTKELARRLLRAEDKASRRIYVNCFFPGNIVTEQWNTWSESFGKLFGTILKKVFSAIGQSVQDGAATAVYLAASEDIPERDIRGQYFVPIAKPNAVSPIANDMKLAAEVWDWIEAKASETLGHDWQAETAVDSAD